MAGLPGVGSCHVVVMDFFRCIVDGVPPRMPWWQLTAFGKAFFINHHFAKGRIFMSKWSWRKQFMLQTGVYREHAAEGTAVEEPVFAICQSRGLSYFHVPSQDSPWDISSMKSSLTALPLPPSSQVALLRAYLAPFWVYFFSHHTVT